MPSRIGLNAAFRNNVENHKDYIKNHMTKMSYLSNLAIVLHNTYVTLKY